jgi:hypothetical protein
MLKAVNLLRFYIPHTPNHEPKPHRVALRKTMMKTREQKGEN